MFLSIRIQIKMMEPLRFSEMRKTAVLGLRIRINGEVKKCNFRQISYFVVIRSVRGMSEHVMEHLRRKTYHVGHRSASAQNV